MQTLSWRTAFLLVLSSVLQVLCFPVAGPLPAVRACLAWLALVPWLWVLLPGRQVSLRRAAAISYGCGVLWYLGTCYWVYATMHVYGGLSAAMSVLALVLMCLYLAVYHAMFGALLAVVARKGRGLALAMAPLLWVAVELARARITGFPWELFGYSQVGNSVLTRLAPVAGVFGLSFVLVAVNAAVAGVLVFPGRRRSAVVALAAAVFAAAVGNAGAHLQPPPQVGSQKAVLLQPNLLVGAGAEYDLNTLASSSVTLTLQASANDQTPTAVALWPESPSPFQTDRSTFSASAAQLTDKLHAPLIAGAVGVDQERGRSQLFNSAVLFVPGVAGPARRYDKIHLVPFGEFVPYKELFAFASGLTQAVGTFDRGTSRQPLLAQNRRYGVFLCYESIFGDEVRRFANSGAEVLVNLSDDGWYGDSSAPFQHLDMARMRAIENHRWLLRDTNSGVTASIDPYGRVVETMPRHQRGAVAVHFDDLTDTTFYTRHGDLFAYFCSAVAVVLVLWSCISSPGRQA